MLADGGDIAQAALQVLDDSAEATIPNNRIVINTQSWESLPALTDALFAQLQNLAEKSGVTFCLKTAEAGYFAVEVQPSAVTARQQAAGPMAAAGAKSDKVLVPAGTYEIGVKVPNWFNNPLRRVTLTHPIEIARYPITNGNRKAFYQEQAGRGDTYALMATASTGRRFALAFGSEADLARYIVPGDIPVELVRVVPEPDTLLGAIPEDQRQPKQPAVSWLYDELVAYTNAHGGRLPTAAEWEIAARTADGDSRLFDYSTRNGLLWDGAEKMADFGGEPPRGVGSFPPNRRGIHDMTGGVWEYLDTFYSFGDVAETVDPTGPITGDYRFVRGGSSFFKDEDFLHAADGYFNDYGPGGRILDVGGRPVWRPQDSK